MSAETELKLTLPGADPRRIAAQLAALPMLAGVVPVTQQLLNRYYDTPAQDLRRAHAALRLRRVRQGAERVRWLQTLKTAGASAGALSQRGEWEVALRGGRLDPIALQGTPWPRLDPHDRWFAQLTPCFETEAQRILRELHLPGGGRVELVLDVGTVRAGARRLALCELELELLDGDPEILFALAAEIATHLPVLPAPLSKAERGWRLADGTAEAPRHARPVALAPDAPLAHAAQALLGEALGQFVENLDGVPRGAAPEGVHQARVGWRRWRSTLWLFKPLLAAHPLPDTAGLGPLLAALCAVRDMDVAALATLPAWSNAFIAGDAARARAWQRLENTVATERARRRAALRQALCAPPTGQVLVALEHWLHTLPQAAVPPDLAKTGLADWAHRHLERLRARLKDAHQALREAEPGSPRGLARQHRLRLLAKRQRYLLDGLRPLLPGARARQQRKQAAAWQLDIGAARDLQLLPDRLAPLPVDRAVLAFLHGVAAGRAAPG